MYLRALLLIVLLAAFSDDGAKEGRRGNGLYKLGEYDQALAQYQAGLARYAEGATGHVPAGLANNLGATLHKVGRYDEALVAFTQSALMATTSAELTRAAYNTGNNAVTLGEMEMALAAYREALLTDPANEDAKFNYEFIKRKMEEQQQQQGNNQNEDENQDDQGQQEQQDQNGEQNDDGQEQQDQQGDQEQDQQGNQEQPDENGEEEQEQEGQQPNEPGEQEEQLSRAQAERILQALQNDEEKLLRQVQKMQGRPRRVEKDW